MLHISKIPIELGADYNGVLKVITVYSGNWGDDALNDHLPIRSSYFNEPGLATIGVPLRVRAYDSMKIKIDIYAMKEKDKV